MLDTLIKKVFGTKHERDLKKINPIVDEINEIYPTLEDVPQEELIKRTEEFKAEAKKVWDELEQQAEEFEWDTKERKEKFKEGIDEYLDTILPEAFAMVKEACRRLKGQTWEAGGMNFTWDMIPYDVQLFGGIVLHQGKIAEMATGEGKTLVATMPVYLNALVGRGVHIITVNDYLARRDAEWMGEVYKYLGLTVGVIQHGQDVDERRAQYNCDITYGTNSEFGFDYLHDNMGWRVEDNRQRGHFYAIVDEVDSVLIDEARTPLIISGPVESTIDQAFRDMQPLVERIAKKQTLMASQFISKAEKALEEENYDDAAYDLLTVRRAAPKNKRFMKIMKEPGVQRMVSTMEMNIMRDKKNLNEIDERIYYAIDEKDHSVTLSEMGLNELHPSDKQLFEIPDIAEAIVQIDNDEKLTPEDKVKAKDRVYKQHIEKSQKLHSITQLLKAYSLFEKDVEYVVQDGKVIIVDEFTGRLMPGRRFSDGLHQAIEAKEKVKIEGETQTVATITLQNYFRMYNKLAGMTGTAETEAGEFWDIYKLDVVVIPTDKPVKRIDFPDQIYRTKKEKYKAIMDEIEYFQEIGRPVLVGTVSVDVSETISRMLKRKGIKHEILNAKQHQREAEIVQFAGRQRAVTIATNMAGRGTDIKLGENVLKHKNCALIETPEYGEVCPYLEKYKCDETPACGLHIIGTERHEARRIDRQLRGRAGRQGDPGSSRFFLSLEDDLMRLFGVDRISRVLDMLGLKEGEAIEHKRISKSIEKAQKSVEGQNYGVRKRLLDYDDVMNIQREVIYDRRNEYIRTDNIQEEVREKISEVAENMVTTYAPPEEDPAAWDLSGLAMETHKMFLAPLDTKNIDVMQIEHEDLVKKVEELALAVYKQKEEVLGSEVMRKIEKMAFLSTVTEKWKDHLYEMDQLRTGIGLRSYAQKDPLIEYKREAFRMFTELLDQIDREAVRFCYWMRPADQSEVSRRERESRAAAKARHDKKESLGFRAPEGGAVQAQGQPGEDDTPQQGKKQPFKREGKKIGRNDPCPCGSGKKYKKCCGRDV
ncbi:MAG TPA: preprotein translocase subunit SecA [candidate division Zixibacteria bacterium]|nr:preprotein translocase subunit SecA [candidate division Zixibacteria bacterium]HEQ98727.1 preprotein translocase subunit SecA [candidate division Zixibacteria bacterium]